MCTHLCSFKHSENKDCSRRLSVPPKHYAMDDCYYYRGLKMTLLVRVFIVQLLSLLCCQTCYSAVSPSNSSPPGQSPNILLIVADDYGYHDVGYHGSEILTPNIDKLARAGVRLENYYVQPVCTPTRSQILSGKYQIHTGLQHEIVWPSQPFGLPLKFPTIADHLRGQGYSTHALGKWHVGMYKKEFTPLYRGFDSFFGFLNGREDYYNHTLCDHWRNGTEAGGRYRDNDTGWAHRPGAAQSKGEDWCGFDLRVNKIPFVTDNKTYSTHMYTDKATEILHNSANSKKPFFMYLAYQAVHEPLQVPEQYMKPYSFIKDTKRRIYAGMVSAMDEGIGNLTTTLRQLGLWNNTIVIFTTDNGGMVPQGGNNFPLRGYKTTLWEGGVRGVGFVSGPPLKVKGRVSHGLMHASDWFPTVAAMVGSKVNASLDLDGKNQWSMIIHGEPSPRTRLLHNIDPLHPPRGDLIYHNTFDHRVRAAVRVGDFKLITGDPGHDKWYPPPTKPYMTLSEPTSPTKKNLWLFNVRDDPSEVNDLSKTIPSKVVELLMVLKELNATAVPAMYPPSDPNCNPKLHGGFWGPWEK